MGLRPHYFKDKYDLVTFSSIVSLFDDMLRGHRKLFVLKGNRLGSPSKNKNRVGKDETKMANE